jgi:hypothetical protein
MYNDLIFKNLIDLSNYNGIETPARGKLVTDSNRVYDIVRKFKSKYGEGEVKKYYMKFDVAAEVPL